MITREEYIQALDVVEAYHKQIRLSFEKYKSMWNINIGDCVECVSVHIQSNNCLTKGNTYKVISVGETSFSIRDDNNKKKRYKYYNEQFKAINEINEEVEESCETCKKGRRSIAQ